MVHGQNPPAGQAEVGMGFFVGLLGSLTTWDVSDADGTIYHMFGVVKEG